jgi:hypothetical protein
MYRKTGREMILKSFPCRNPGEEPVFLVVSWHFIYSLIKLTYQIADNQFLLLLR